MNYAHWLEYKQIPKDQKMLIIWVDYLTGFLYGNYVDRLIELESNEYPYYMPHSVSGSKQNWNIEDMIRFNDLFGFNNDLSDLDDNEIKRLERFTNSKSKK